MKRVAVFTTSILLSTFLANAQELSKEAKIERLLTLMNGEAALNQVFEQMKTMMASTLSSATPPGATSEQRARALEIQTKTLDLLKARVNWEKLKPEYIKWYSETFSDDEIDGILAFFESPAGRAMQAKTPMLVSKIIAWSQAQVSELLPEIQRLISEAPQK